MIKEKIPSQEKETLDFKRILPILIIVLVDLMGLTIIIPLLPLYATAFGADPFTIGALGATYPLMQFIGAPILGRLSDKYGRKPILVISQIGTFIGFIVLGFANGLPLLFISRIIDGISGANIATAQAAISDSTTAKTRTQGLGLIGAAFGLGFIIGPIITGISLKLSGNNYHVPALVAAGFSALSILLSIGWLKETLPAEKRGQTSGKKRFSMGGMLTAVRHPAVGFLLLLMLAQQLAFGGFEQLVSLFTFSRLGLNAFNNSFLFVYLGVIIVMIQGGLIGKMSQKLGDRKLVLMGLLLLAIGLFAAAFTPKQAIPPYSIAKIEAELATGEAGLGSSVTTEARVSIQEIKVELPSETNKGWTGLAWLVVALIPTAVGGAVLRPTLNSLITKQVKEDEVGGILGISTGFSSIANAIAPIMGGLIFQYAGATTLFVVWGALLAILWLTAVRFIPETT